MEYFDKLLDESEWNSGSLETHEACAAPVKEISTSEVRAAIAKMKSVKEAGPSGKAAEMLKTACEESVLLVTGTRKAIIKLGEIMTNSRKGWIVCVCVCVFVCACVRVCVCVQRERRGV
jgi:hypothetical protein